MQLAFKVGDKAVYPAQGVVEITGIETKSILGNREVFYVLRVLDTQKKIMVPVTKVEVVGLRPVTPAGDIPALYDLMRERDVELDTSTWNRRHRRYLEKIKSGSIVELAEIVRDLHVMRLRKPLSFGEKKMLELAMGLLVKELAVSRGVPVETIEEELHDIFADTEPPPEDESKEEDF